MVWVSRRLAREFRPRRGGGSRSVRAFAQGHDPVPLALGDEPTVLLGREEPEASISGIGGQRRTAQPTALAQAAPAVPFLPPEPRAFHGEDALGVVQHQGEGDAAVEGVEAPLEPAQNDPQHRALAALQGRQHETHDKRTSRTILPQWAIRSTRASSRTPQARADQEFQQPVVGAIGAQGHLHRRLGAKPHLIRPRLAHRSSFSGCSAWASPSTPSKPAISRLTRRQRRSPARYDRQASTRPRTRSTRPFDTWINRVRPCSAHDR